MKTAYLLFGLASAACGSPQAAAQFPLCDGAGAPACGNIGQVGRDERVTMTVTQTQIASARVAAPPAPAMLTTVATAAQRAAPVVTRVLVGASQQMIQRGTLSARPLVDHREDIACGNVMSKGGSRRVCRDAEGTIVTETDLDEHGHPSGQTLVSTP